MCHQIFEKSVLKRFLLTSTVYISYSAFLRIFSVSREGPNLGIFGGRTERREICGKQSRCKLQLC